MAANTPTVSPTPDVMARASFWKRTYNTRSAYLYMLPALLVMAVITLYPLGFQVWMSFTDYGLKNLKVGAPPPNMVGLNNYINILKFWDDGDKTQLPLKDTIPNFDFWRLIAFNIIWAVTNVVFHVIIGVLVAVVLNVEGLWFKRIYRAIYILPVVIPAIIIATVWKNMFDQQSGAVNVLLRGIGSVFGIPGAAFDIPWLENYAKDPIPFIPLLPLAYFAMLIANTWLGWPLNSVVATGALQSIPKELYEAARVDGASGIQQFFTVTVPMLRPAMLPYAIYGFIVTFNLFFLSYFLSGGNPFGRTELLVTQAYRLVNEKQLYGVASAFCIIEFFILLGITLITNRLAKLTAEV